MKAGLEVHQQLSTGKLFCSCPSELSEEVIATALRRLRATGGENHHVDAAAAFQAARGLAFRYEATPTSCLVELDEEPPHPLNSEALDVALTLALLLDARPLDEVEVMRKIVVDGSNPAGFQRTALVAVDGRLTLSGKSYSIPTICLEEDAARKLGEADQEVRYRLDRLGVPLIEVATGPEVASGTEAREVAEEIGALLRSTGRVRRGIGSIREDVNVSTEGGARVEIKGVQELRLLARYAEGEEERQRALLRVREALVARHAPAPAAPLVDVTELVRPAAKGPLGNVLKQGGHALGLALRGFGGLLGSSAADGERLGRELADRARAAGVRGLLHSDELPAQGLEGASVGGVRKALGVEGPDDAFVLIAASDAARAERALERVRERAQEALAGVPGETRDPLPDGRTRYSRPLPGRDRMYPETDVPPIPITSERLERLRRSLPERPEALRARLVAEYSLGAETARLLQRSGEAATLEALVREGATPSGAARLLTQDLPNALAGLGDAEARELPTRLLASVLSAVERGEFAKEGVGQVLTELLKGADSVAEAAERAGLSALSAEELGRLARDLVARNAELLRTRGMQAFSPLMGDLMREVRGRRDGEEVARVLRDEVARQIGPGR